MKRILAFLLTGVILASCSEAPVASNDFTINGSFDIDFTGMAYLQKREDGEFVKIDSVAIENNTFALKGNIDIPEVYYFSVSGQQSYLPIFVEASDISLNIPSEIIKEAKISGSKSQEEYDAYTETMSGFEDQLRTSWQAFEDAKSAGEDAEKEKLEKELDDLDAKMQSFVLENAKTNNASIAAAYALYRNSYYYDETDLGPVVDNFDESISNSIYVKELNDYVNTLQMVAIGNPAVDFTMNDTEGNPVTLSSLYGGYLLVDFWASWCGPCRRENPNVVLAYQTYNEKGFDILGVSFDSKKDKWMKAIEDDGLTWLHVGDLKGWGNAAGKLYAIRSIPSNMLLDPEGIIIAKNLRAEDLQDKLAEIFKD